jgi:outer membrane translocation and assembly module TamA
MTFGDVPYFKLPRLGGDKMMRGYYFGRYRDNVYYMGQVEYRKQIADRFYLVAFFGLGRVSDKFKNVTLKNLHPTYGLGLRFVLDVMEKLNIRLDIGFGDNGTSGVYFNAEEAF